MLIYPKEGLAHCHKVGDVQQPDGVKVLQLYFPLLKQPHQKGVGRVPETPCIKDAEGDHLTRPRVREDATNGREGG